MSRGVLPYISHIGIYYPKGYGFCAVLVLQFKMSKEEREICEVEMEFKKSFLLLFYLSNGDVIN